jgi:hypothetical protein
VSKETKCDCDDSFLMAVEYDWTSKNHYDGISEWRCEKCGQRVGRWSGNILKEGESEPRWGIKR